MSENECPECLSKQIDKFIGERQSDDCEVWYCYCRKCSCEYTVIYQKIVEIDEHGSEFDEEEYPKEVDD